MGSEPQVRANTDNAQRSTVPRTDEGKAVAARNALKHGLRSAHYLLPEEDPAPLAALQDALRRDLSPSGPMEQLLCDRVVAAAWRLRRAYLVECGIYERVRGTFEPGDLATAFTQQLRRKFQDACALGRRAGETLALRKRDRAQHAPRAGGAAPGAGVARTERQRKNSAERTQFRRKS